MTADDMPKDDRVESEPEAAPVDAGEADPVEATAVHAGAATAPVDPVGAARQARIDAAAARALAEAEARRANEAATEMPKELGGRDGPEPVRYGDWEKKGIAIDF